MLDRQAGAVIALLGDPGAAWFGIALVGVGLIALGWALGGVGRS